MWLKTTFTVSCNPLAFQSSSSDLEKLFWEWVFLDGHSHMLGASAGTVVLLSRWTIIFKEANPGLFTCQLCLREQQQKLQGILKHRSELTQNHFCFILVVKRSHKTSPYWMCGWEIISSSGWEKLQRRSGCWQYTTLWMEKWRFLVHDQ